LAPLRHRHREARCQQFSGLARQLLIKHHSAVGLVDRLVDQGYLVRKPSREDGRKVELRLTAKGTRVLGRLADMRRHELVHASPELTALLAQITHPTEAGAGA
jgi:DNA-binding MarR family transcriptional regulator